VAHDKYLCVPFVERLREKELCLFVKPSRPGLLVIPEWEPQILKGFDFLVMPVSPEVDNVCETERLEPFQMLPGCDCAAKRQPPIYEVRLHRSHALFRPGLT
jgi:hypothetical protein